MMKDFDFELRKLANVVNIMKMPLNIGTVSVLQRRRWILQAASVLGVVGLLRALLRWWAQRRSRAYHLCLSSPLEGSDVKLANPKWKWKQWWQFGAAELEKWRGHCPVCRRPIEAQICQAWRPPRPKPEVRGKFAYVITLWGSSADYLIGAMVLGQSLKRTQTKHTLICLHTDDVPEGFIRMLSALWECRLIEHVDACTEQLSFQDGAPHRFDKVFTKLRVLALTDFAKVLLMDIDLLVMDNIDELFDLPTPAALRRGMNDTRWPLKTGNPVEGRPFFGGRDTNNPKWSWGQGTGINAGVMLLQPDVDVLENMLTEIQEPNHPSHVRGNGPEQDYLSRYWADAPWRYIGVEYNFQLHQMFFALHPNWASNAERGDFFRSPEKIKVIHFSGVPAAKPWHRVLDEKFAAFWPDRSRDSDYTRMFADEFLGHWLWVRKDPATWNDLPKHHQRSEMQDLYLSEDGQIMRKSWKNWSDPPTVVEMPEEATRGAMTILDRALGSWFDCFEELEASLKTCLKRDIAMLSSASAMPASMLVKTAHGTADTGGTDSKPRSPAPQDQPVHRTTENRIVPAAGVPSFFRWRRAGGWWIEGAKDPYERFTATCGCLVGRAFVSFCEGDSETFGEHSDDQLSGLFVKVVGQHSARHFSIPVPSHEKSEGSDDELSSTLASITLWSETVQPGSLVFLAMLNVFPESTPEVFKALEPLGVPQFEGSTSDYKAFAAVGQCPEDLPAEEEAAAGGSLGWFGEKRGNAAHNAAAAAQARKTIGARIWSAAHASRDVAYASIPLSVP